MSLEEIDRAIRVLAGARSRAWCSIRWPTSCASTLRSTSQSARPTAIQADLSIRGASFGQTLVLLNGSASTTLQSGHHNMDIPVPLESRRAHRSDARVRLHALRLGRFGRRRSTSSPSRRKAAELRLRTALGNFGINQQRASLAGVAGKTLRAAHLLARFFYRLPARPRLPQSRTSPPPRA